MRKGKSSSSWFSVGVVGLTFGLVGIGGMSLSASGCATTAPPDQRAQNDRPPVRPVDHGFATQNECAQVADHLFTIELHNTSVNVPQEHLLDGSNLEHRAQFNAFVTKCTTELTHKDAACVLAAPAFQYVHQCELTQGTPSLVSERSARRFR